jgi:biotin operon repressor
MTQQDAILAALKSGQSLTPIDALQQFGCMRLAARINALRNEGVQIDTHFEQSDSGSRYARYTIQGAH